MPQHAIIVSHGQPSDPDPAETALATLAREVAILLPGWDVTSATLAKPGALDAALEQAGTAPLIYPMFMSAGWFTRSELKRRLAKHDARTLPPFGHDAGLPDLAAGLVRSTLAERNWQAKETQLFIAGHGSGRSPNAARDTHRFADALARRLPMGEQRVGFVEEPPRLTPTATGLGAQSICLPFFAAKGGHVIEDIPEALNTTGFKGILLEPLGLAPGVPRLIAQALRKAART